MPTYPKRRYRKRYPKKASWYDKKYSARSLAIKGLKNIHYIKGLINSELLKHDNTFTATISSTGVVNNLTNIGQGDSVSTRTGNSIFVRSIFGRIAISHNNASNNTFHRIILFIDTQNVSDTSPAVTDVLQASGITAPLNRETVGRFKILMDRYFATNTVDTSSKVIKINKQMRHHVRFNGATSNDIQKGGIYILMLSSEPTNTPSYTYTLRTSYHDN